MLDCGVLLFHIKYFHAKIFYMKLYWLYGFKVIFA